MPRTARIGNKVQQDEKSEDRGSFRVMSIPRRLFLWARMAGHRRLLLRRPLRVLKFLCTIVPCTRTMEHRCQML